MQGRGRSPGRALARRIGATHSPESRVSKAPIYSVLAVLSLLAAAASARAGEDWHDMPGYLSELRLGGLVHNVEAEGSERGFDVNAELLLAAPGWSTGTGWADVLLRPRPTLGASLNSDGGTDKVYLGLTWSIGLWDGLDLELGFGGAAHDGPLVEADVASYGCRLNFRESAALALDLDPRWRLIAGIEHMSNADLCARNRGLTSAGLRLGYRLD